MIGVRMAQWLLLFSILVCVYALNSDREECGPKCDGPGYLCLNSKCYCADGFIPNRFQTTCVKCPGLGEKCFGPCCNSNGNASSLHCWYGVCQPCTDAFGNWICRDSLDQILLITSTQAIMGTALILGIVATFVLLIKLCFAADIRNNTSSPTYLTTGKDDLNYSNLINDRPMGSAANYNTRLSVGSLQLYIDERLRNAPPRYSRTPPTEPDVYSDITYHNDGFVNDCSVPPPPYTEEIKEENQQPPIRGNVALHM